MKRRVVMLSVTLGVGIYLGVIGDRLLSAQPEPVKRTVLLKTDLAGIKGKEGLIVLAEIAPGAATGKHTHPAHEFAYVLEGSGTLEVEGKPATELKPGTAIHQPPGQIHSGKNASASAPLRIVSFYITEKGKPLAAPVK